MWSSEFQHLREACGCPEVAQVEIECVQAGGQLEKLGNNFGSLLGVVYSKSNGWLGHATGNPRVVSVYPYPYPLRVRTRFPRVCTRCGYGFLAHGYGFLRVWHSTGLAGANKHSRHENGERTYTQPEEA